MSIADAGQISEIIMDAAAEMAKKLGMTQEEDMTALSDDQQAMMVTSAGIVVGKIRAAHVESRAGMARYDTYLLEDTIMSPASFSETRLCKYMFLSDGKGGFCDEGDIVCSLPEGAVLYTR